jgi:transcriptional regulator with XRE-family HTH domain
MERRQDKNTRNYTPVTLAEYIRHAREVRGISARMLSAKVQMDPSYIGRVEAGRFKRPSLEKLHRIADYLKLDYSSLCALAGYHVPGLPSFPGYLRLKYEMSDDDARRLTTHFELLRAQHGIVEKTHPNADMKDLDLTDEMKRMQDDDILLA